MPVTDAWTRRGLLASSLIGIAVSTTPLMLPKVARAAARDDGSTGIAIEHVTVLSMAPGSTAQADMTVLIAGERITAIEPGAEIVVPPTFAPVDGSGKWLIPGLIDTHVHFMSERIPELEFTPAQILAPYLANGVLQIVDMAATPETNIIRDAVAAAEIVAPFIASAAMIDGSPAMRPGAREIARPEDARETIQDIAEAGFDFIKVYSQLDPEVFDAVLTAAEEFGIRVIGHIPGGRTTPAEEFIKPGFALIAHAEEFSWQAPEKSEEEIVEFTRLMQETGAALSSTLFLDQQILAQIRDPDVVAETEGIAYVHPVELMLWFEQNPYLSNRSTERIATLEAVIDFNDRLTAAFVDAGIPVFAGTDGSFVPGLAPGFSLHEELVALVEAGLSPRQALEAATVAPATWLGVVDDRGTVEVGKRANLVLLDADPLSDIQHTRSINAVFFNGEMFDQQALDARLSELDALYAPHRAALSPEAATALEN